MNNSIVLKSPAKLNLTLEILDKYKDDFHEINSVVLNVNLFDEIKIEKSNRFEIYTNAEIDAKENLIYKAYQLLFEQYGKLPTKVNLTKNIPLDSGLGGGSSNAANFLQGMNKLWSLDLNKNEQYVELEKILDDFGLKRIRNTQGNLLSGGERRRLEIARAISMKPKFILLDEPFAGVDPIAIQDIQNMIKKLKERSIGVLITDHNVRETLSITDRSYLLYDGKILKYGKTLELVNDEQVRKLYLGDNFKF